MKHFNLALVLITIIAIWVIPTYAYILVILSLLLSLALSTCDGLGWVIEGS